MFPPKEEVGSVSGTEGSSGRELLSKTWGEGPEATISQDGTIKNTPNTFQTIGQSCRLMTIPTHNLGRNKGFVS